MVAEFDSVDELWLDAASKIYYEGGRQPSRDGESQEILGYTARLKDPRYGFMFNPIRRIAPHYAAAEVLWYLSGTNEIEMIKAYAPQYERFSHDGKHAHGAYGYRWKQYNQIDNILKLLRTKPDTRQAVMTCWSPADLQHAVTGGFPDMPCTLTLNFIVRQGKLYLHANMRSNDIWLGMPYDIFAFTCLQRIIAHELGLELGWYQHSAMSLHVYYRNFERFEEAVHPPAFNVYDINSGPMGAVWPHNLEAALLTEKHARETGYCSFMRMEAMGRYSLFAHLVIMAACKWATPPGVEVLANRITDKNLAKYVSDWWKEKKCSSSKEATT